MNQFLSGAMMISFVVISMFFARFWINTRERLFIVLATAFGLLAFERIVLLNVPVENEARTYVYLIRLVAFLAIIYGVIEKNSRGRTGE